MAECPDDCSRRLNELEEDKKRWGDPKDGIFHRIEDELKKVEQRMMGKIDTASIAYREGVKRAYDKSDSKVGLKLFIPFMAGLVVLAGWGIISGTDEDEFKSHLKDAQMIDAKQQVVYQKWNENDRLWREQKELNRDIKQQMKDQNRKLDEIKNLLMDTH